MPALSADQRRALIASGCELRDDDLSRVLYATDASLYRVEPAAVAFPRSTAEVAAVCAAAHGSGVELIPRGAGSGLAGGAVGPGVVLDLARHSRWIGELDREGGTVEVGAGVVLDQLNAFLAPHGLVFGPDVATASRATIGGMVANNSSGAHAPVYGTTADHLSAVEVVLADGRVRRFGDPDGDDLAAAARAVAERHRATVRERMPGGLRKRWPGYGFDRFLATDGDMTQLIGGSEGTLAAVVSARLKVVPLPAARGLAVVFFDSVAEAMQATVELLDLEPAAVEHLDRMVFDHTRGQSAFARARSLLELDEKPAEALLLVEFFDDDVATRLEEVRRRRLGRRTTLCGGEVEQELVWTVRRAGLSLVTARPGAAKPVAGIEDVCVRPERLPEYVAGLVEILSPLGLEASFYGHAASGELHVRPVVDMHTEEGVRTLRLVADQVADLCRRFGGSLCGEHGVGMARAEYLEAQLGPELMEANREIKRIFDPSGILNPGKVLHDGRYAIDRNLRLGAGAELVLPFAEVFSFVERDRSFVGNLEQCNGCAGCRKDAPTMCPTFVATGEELMSTRGRANLVRAALEGRFGAPGLAADELSQALDACLACKACKKECPSGVDMAMLKAELKHARHRLEGIPWRDRVIAAADTLGRVGTAVPGLVNWTLERRWVRQAMEKLLGFSADRTLPPFARQRFDRWWSTREHSTAAPTRGRVMLWDDTWVRYHEPGVGRAAVAVLEAAGWEVTLVEDRACCGRPACSRGLLDEVRRLAEHNLGLLAGGSQPIVFLEPSCYAMFVDEYRNLELDGADAVARRCILFEDLILDLLDAEPAALPLRETATRAAVHVHCHAKALGDPVRLRALAAHAPGLTLELLDTGCCGMAGAFGMLRATEELSKQVAGPLLEAVRALSDDTRVVASGTSCRHQLAELGQLRSLHFAELVQTLLR